MPRVKSPKNATVAFKAEPRIAGLVSQAASSEGMNVSEWIRTLMVEELKRRGLLPTTTPPLEVEASSNLM